MHKNASAAIQRHIDGVLKNCAIEAGWPVPDSIQGHLPSLWMEVLKHKERWLTAGDIVGIFYDFVHECVSRIEGALDTKNGLLSALLGELKLADLSANLLAYVESVPRPYEVFLQLPKTSLSIGTVEFTDTFSVVAYEDADEFPGEHKAQGLLGPIEATQPSRRLYFRYKTSGYCSSDLDNPTVSHAYACFKIAFQQAMAGRLLGVREKSWGLSLYLGRHSVEKSKIHCVDKGERARATISVELPIDVCRFLESLEFLETSKVVEAATAAGGLSIHCERIFKLPSLLMNSAAPEARRVRSAIEWCFDSATSESKTLSFLQVCIGLEALLGDESDVENLTKTLADRCAYLVAPDMSTRKIIREDFRKLYSTRSKIVHGSTVALQPSEQNHLSWGRNVLQLAIAKEIRHLDLESEVKQK